MQKKIIAVAVAGLVSGAAFAQTNVTIYGAADMSYAYVSDNYNSGVKSTSQINSGSLNGSRVGFRGTEDLGNGLSANFRLEAGINMDVGTSAQTGTFGRWTTVGLSSQKLGEIQIGRRDTFHDQLVGGASGNGRGTVDHVGAVYLAQTRIGNFVAYLSPIWSGLQVKAGVSTAGADTAAQEVEPTEITAAGQNTAANTNLRVYTVAVHYNNGPLLLGAAYDYNKLQERSSDVAGIDGSYKSGNVWNIAGAYDFGVVRLDGAVGMINYAANTQPAINEIKDNRKQWTLGLTVPFGAKDRIHVNYARAKLNYLDSGIDDDTMSFYGASYFHDLSKRTTLYAAYGKVRQDDDTFTKADLDGSVVGNYQQGIQVGIRHWF